MPPVEMVPLDPDRTRAPRVKVMVSSREKELKLERDYARETIDKFGFQALLFEGEGPTGKTPGAESVHLAAECHVFVLIVGAQVSDVVRGEYEMARKRLTDEILVFTKTVRREPAADEFVLMLEGTHKREAFRTPEEFRVRLYGALLRVAEEAILYRQSTRDEFPFRPLLNERVSVGAMGYVSYPLRLMEGERVEGLIEALHYASLGYRYDVMSEGRYAEKVSALRDLQADTLLPKKRRVSVPIGDVAEGMERAAHHLEFTAPQTGVFYLWIHTTGPDEFSIELRSARPRG